ncbi:hypothetical protein GQ53DRAFT_821608 [Thozetella sp. PMI_491]|nr:hypothetical protein GQ53DRAFT_821608 [Thozetella sp. PMI_491]
MKILEAFAFAAASLDGVRDLDSPVFRDHAPKRDSISSVVYGRANGSTTASNTTINMFIDDGLRGRAGYAASIVSACIDQTVYAIRCTSAYYAGSDTCGPSATPLTITSASTTYAGEVTAVAYSYGTLIDIYATEGCVLAGSTAATCSATAELTEGSSSTVVSSTTTLTGTNYHRFDVIITGGLERLADATTTCAGPSTRTSRPTTSTSMNAAVAGKHPALATVTFISFIPVIAVFWL